MPQADPRADPTLFRWRQSGARRNSGSRRRDAIPGAGVGGPDRARNMRPPLGPIDADPAEAALLPRQLVDVDAEPAEQPGARLGHLAALLAQHQDTLGHQLIGKRHAQSAGEMVVAKP